MKDNMEEREDYLKRHSPYQVNGEQWEAMQQRLKAGVLADRAQLAPPRSKRLMPRLAAGMAAGIALILSIYVVQQQNGPHTATPARQLSPEQQLDKAISSLSDAELSWIHQLNEEELAEAGESSEN